MNALLSYVIRIAHTARGNIQNAIKGAPLKEILKKKIAEQECYKELVEIILSAITDIRETCDISKDHETHVGKINDMINFMHKKGVKPGCKTLTRETSYSDFIYAGNDAETISSARDIANSNMEGDKFIKQWRIRHNDKMRAKNKIKQRDIWEKWWGE